MKRAVLKSALSTGIEGALDGSPAALEALRVFFLALLDGMISRVPEELRPGLQRLRDELASLVVLPEDLRKLVMDAITNYLLTGDYGPATGSDADHA